MVLKRDFVRRLNMFIMIAFIIFTISIGLYFWMTFRFKINSINSIINVIQNLLPGNNQVPTLRAGIGAISFLFYTQLIIFVVSIASLLLGFWFTTQRYLVEKRNALIDPLTQIYNRKAVFFELRREMRRSERFGSSTSVAMIDIDLFKKYNDTLGHVAGDRLLKKFGGIIKRNVRDYDIFGRYGGEEFIIVFPRTKIKDAKKICERFRKDVEETEFYGESKLPHKKVTISIGVAEVKGKRLRKETLVDKADKNLYRAKHAGRNQVIAD